MLFRVCTNTGTHIAVDGDPGAIISHHPSSRDAERASEANEHLEEVIGCRLRLRFDAVHEAIAVHPCQMYGFETEPDPQSAAGYIYTCSAHTAVDGALFFFYYYYSAAVQTNAIHISKTLQICRSINKN